jgi:uncharacterized protein
MAIMIDKVIEKKYNQLKNFLKDLGSVVIAFSGGLDSGFLCKVSFEVLGDKAVAVTAISPTYPLWDLKEAKKIAQEIGIKHILINTDEFKNKNFLKNSYNRCYWCKRELFSKLKKIAEDLKYKFILDGTNYQDKYDHRPGMKANKEFGVISPLYECKFNKEDIKKLAKFLKLSFWNKSSGTCLSSRIPFGERITLKRLKRIEKAESILKDFLEKNVLIRARDHQKILRIEIENNKDLFKKDTDKIIKELKKIGYKYITLDLEGYIPAGKR